ncbi:MAG: cyclopropane-fatty-acyl-phospholipid synthase [Blastococcus sp.]|jgi:cyclopropane-fatty-acyl-phospholipid synthase|nr:cyclopropane-fatty-acyl-phospholipid synthase [Blastococcus sp.]
MAQLMGIDLPYRLRGWDGSEAGPTDAPATVVLRSRRALRTLLWQPDELGLARAFVAGDLDIEGDLYAALASPELMTKLATNEGLSLTTGEKVRAVGTLARLGALGRRPPLPPEEIVRPGWLGRMRHDESSDAAAISHHYDVGNDFYALALGPSMVYSCAYWTRPPSPDFGLEDAQREKLDLVCRKLALQPGQRLLDVGCGWGSLVLHAAQEFGVHAVGVTLSREQAQFARARISAAGLADRVEIRLQDYRAVDDGPYDAIASVGMAEHVGSSQLEIYAAALQRLLVPGGRLLHHAIASHPEASGIAEEPRSSFIDRYVFPDGELEPLGATITALDRAGFEIRDVENLREHYALTLRAWVSRLEENWDAAVELTSPGRARVWRLYMVASALAFQFGEITVNQTLAVVRSPDGRSGMPLTREDLQPRAGN